MRTCKGKPQIIWVLQQSVDTLVLHETRFCFLLLFRCLDLTLTTLSTRTFCPWIRSLPVSHLPKHIHTRTLSSRCLISAFADATHVRLITQLSYLTAPTQCVHLNSFTAVRRNYTPFMRSLYAVPLLFHSSLLGAGSLVLLRLVQICSTEVSWTIELGVLFGHVLVLLVHGIVPGRQNHMLCRQVRM